MTSKRVSAPLPETLALIEAARQCDPEVRELIGMGLTSERRFKELRSLLVRMLAYEDTDPECKQLMMISEALEDIKETEAKETPPLTQVESSQQLAQEQDGVDDPDTSGDEPETSEPAKAATHLTPPALPFAPELVTPPRSAKRERDEFVESSQPTVSPTPLRLSQSVSGLGESPSKKLRFDLSQQDSQFTLPDKD